MEDILKILLDEKNITATFTLLGVLITGIITFAITILQAKMHAKNLQKEREYNFNKEKYFKLQEKVEIIFEALNYYYDNIGIIIYSINRQLINEQDFTFEEVNKRKSKNFKVALNYMYLYFNELYKDKFLSLMDLYKEIEKHYLEKILGAPRTGNWLNYTNDDIQILFDKQKIFNSNFILFVDLLNKELEDQEKNIFKNTPKNY